VDNGAKFSECRKYRYLLWRIWDADKKYLFVIGLNPSTADESKDDRTIRRCIGFSKAWGYGGLVMGNLFAFKATKPKDMEKADDPIGDENDCYLLQHHNNAGLTLAAWGKNGDFLNRDKEVMGMLADLHCLVVTKNGFPKHPLYCKADLTPIMYYPDVQVVSTQ